MGDRNDETNKGIIPRVVGEIFDTIQKQAVNSTEKKYMYEIKVGYVEIYMEKVRDLLNPRRKLKLREKKGEVFIENVTEEWVSSANEVYETMRVGDHNRVVAHTEMNESSSRSHSVFPVFFLF